MGMTQHAYIGWGVRLGGQDDEDYYDDGEGDGLWELSEKDAYADVIELSYAGHCDYGFPVIFLKRSYGSAYWGSEEVKSDLTPPTSAEKTVMDRFLDDAGYNGPRDIKLLLVASYG